MKIGKGERWLPIPGYERYEVSDLGRVRSYRHRGGGLRDTPKPLKPGVGNNGYLACNLCDGAGGRKRRSVHRMVALAFHEPSPKDKLFALHRNGDKLDNRPDNIYWGTLQDNALDAVRHGTWVDNAGEKFGRSKLTNSEVREIRRRYAAGGILQKELGAEYGVAANTICYVVQRKTWKHIK